MVKQSTFIITVVVITILWIISLIGMSFYYENKIREVLQEKENITIVQDIEQKNEDTGLENVIVE
jgi:preprotein translocase subunit SecG